MPLNFWPCSLSLQMLESQVRCILPHQDYFGAGGQTQSLYMPDKHSINGDTSLAPKIPYKCPFPLCMKESHGLPGTSCPCLTYIYRYRPCLFTVSSLAAATHRCLQSESLRLSVSLSWELPGDVTGGSQAGEGQIPSPLPECWHL